MSTNIHDLSSPVNDDSSSRKKAYFSEAYVVGFYLYIFQEIFLKNKIYFFRSPLIHQIESNKTNSILPAFLSSSGTSFITPADGIFIRHILKIRRNQIFKFFYYLFRI